MSSLSFSVQEGENFVLLGTSGCGKTTTLKMLNRLIEPTAGDIFINQQNIREQQPELLRRSIGYALQHTGLFPHYTVSENIAVVPRLCRWQKDKINSRVEALMHKLRLPAAYRNAYPHELSGGEQQRVGLARALAADAAILLMDEPFGALDPITRSSIRNDFKNLDEFKLKTIVLVTHDVQEAFELADRICLMHNGSIVQTGTPEALLFTPANDFVRGFFAAQRLQLEYRTVTVNKLWHFLPGDEVDITQAPLNTTISVWDALEQLGQAETAYRVVQENGRAKRMDEASLLRAFHQYKQSLIN